MSVRERLSNLDVFIINAIPGIARVQGPFGTLPARFPRSGRTGRQWDRTSSWKAIMAMKARLTAVAAELAEVRSVASG